MHTIQVNAVAYRDGENWVAQGIEKDLVVHAQDISGLVKAFKRTMLERLAIGEHLGVDPFYGVGPAPEKFRVKFEDAKMELKDLQPSESVSSPVFRLAEAS